MDSFKEKMALGDQMEMTGESDFRRRFSFVGESSSRESSSRESGGKDMGAIGEGKGNNKTAWVTWIHTPATCKECGHYDKNKRRCGVKECPYPARRGKS